MNILRSFRAWRAYRHTVKELDGMSDRALSDLGITRGQIREAVRPRQA